MALQFRVNGLAGPICAVEGERTWTVRQLKTAVEAVAAVPIFEQRLLQGTTELQCDDASLGEALALASLADFSSVGSAPPLNGRRPCLVDLSLVRRPQARASWMQKVDKSPWELCFAPEEVRADKEVVLAAVQRNGPALEYAVPSLRADRDVALAAVRQNGLAFEYVAEALKADTEIVQAALQKKKLWRQVLKHVTPDLWADRVFVLGATECHESFFQFASKDLLNDRAFVLKVVHQQGQALQFVSAELQEDQEVVEAAVQASGLALQHASPILQANREVVMIAVTQNGLALKYASNDLRADRSIVLTAIRQNATARMAAHSGLQMDPEVLRVALCRPSKLPPPKSASW